MAWARRVVVVELGVVGTDADVGLLVEWLLEPLPLGV